MPPTSDDWPLIAVRLTSKRSSIVSAPQYPPAPAATLLPSPTTILTIRYPRTRPQIIPANNTESWRLYTLFGRRSYSLLTRYFFSNALPHARNDEDDTSADKSRHRGVGVELLTSHLPQSGPGRACEGRRYRFYLIKKHCLYG